MSIKVSNFGPIKNADITFKPFTLLIGKNIQGKSYITQLYHILIQLFLIERAEIDHEYTWINFSRYRLSAIRRFGIVPQGASFVTINITGEEYKYFRKNLKNNKTSNKKIIDIILNKLKKDIKDQFSGQLKFNFEQIYGPRISNLVSLNSTSSKISFSVNEYYHVNITITKKNRLTLNIFFSKENMDLIEKNIHDDLTNLRSSKRMTSSRIRKFIIQLFRTIFKVPLTESIFIPAGRAGLIDGYDSVVSSLLNIASVAPLYGLTMPPLPGVASQFYNRLFSLRERSGPYSELSEKFHEILGGSISLRRIRGLPSAAFRMIYTFTIGEETRSIEVVHAASMVKELAPIYIILKLSVYPNSYLIIEEIESHLHPSAQCKITEVLAEYVVNKGLCILTTHSDIIIRKLGNLIGNYRYNIDENMISINPDLISLYLLKETEEGSISITIPIPEDGIFEEIPEFDDVISELYDEHLKIQRITQLEE